MSASNWKQLKYTASQSNADGELAHFEWRTLLEKDTKRLQGNFYVSKGSPDYFVDGKEFRVVLEWTKDTGILQESTQRIARVGLYVPIEQHIFNTTKATTRLIAKNFYGSGEPKRQAITMVSSAKN